MRFPWRDGLATLFVAIALGTYAAFALDRALPGFTSVAAVAVAVLALGVAASASAVVPGFGELLRGSRMYMAVTSALGLVALGTGVWGLVAGEETALSALVLSTLALWVMSTVRHLAQRPRHGLIRR